MAEKKLTEKEEIFCIEYTTNGYNATQAALSAGYSEKSAKEIGCQNLTKLHIQNRINELKADFQKTMAEIGITRERTAKEVSKIAFSSFQHLHNDWFTRKEWNDILKDHPEILDCIDSIDTKIVKQNIGNKSEPEIIDVEYVKVKFYSKLTAIDTLNKMMGWNEPDKTDLNVPGGFQIILQKRETSKD